MSDQRPDVLPLFPLPNVVALPGLVIPLNVFEPRYRDLVADLDPDAPFLALAVLMPGFEADYQGCPEIHPVVSGGRFLSIEAAPDGRYEVVFVCMGRATLLGEDQETHRYRVGTVRWEDDPAPERAVELHLRLELHDLLDALGKATPLLAKRLDALRAQDLALGTLVDQVGTLLPLRAEVRLALLEELEPTRRALLLIEVLRQVTGAEAGASSLN